MLRLFCFCARVVALLSSVDYSDPAYIDLSKATKLRDAVFQPTSMTVTWVVMTLRTITTEHRDLQQILIHAPHDEEPIGETICRQWSDLDCLLVQFWESHSIRPKVVLDAAMRSGRKNVKSSIGFLLPEITKGGIIDFVEPDLS